MTLTGIHQFKALLKEKLSDIYPEQEIDQLGKIALQEVLNVSSTQLLLWPDNKLTETQDRQLINIANRLAKTEPIQYILGYTTFYDLKIKVSPAVLIPRSETEELVHWILNDPTVDKSSILDIGTGSGCIALALKQNLPMAQIEGWDISEEALHIARQNARALNLDVTFRKKDILNTERIFQFDCIVSNPPYVRTLEKKMMEPNVLEHEPHLALFVDNDNPLLFYRAIARKGLKALTTKGSLFFEINEQFRKEMVEMLTRLGYINIECKKDLQGKDRMIKAIKP